MISVKSFFELLQENKITFFTGVPDSLLKDFCAYVTDNVTRENHIINSNEGAAVSLACGYYLATGKSALVYMQNSGLGNAVNPLLSLADQEVYSIPVLLMIGWRGEPGKKDEPQHKKQGRVMLKMLESMEIPFGVISSSTKDFKKIIDNSCKLMNERKSPVAIIVSEGTFEKYNLRNDVKDIHQLKREDAIKIILRNMREKDILVSTTGKASREVFEYREKNNQSHENDFLTVGSMGHSSQIALGISLRNKDKEIFVLDGDGSTIMQMGSLAILGTEAPENFKHIVINNGSHDSVGGQPTAGFSIDIPAIAKSCGYNITLTAENEDQIIEGFNKLKHCKGPSLLEIRVNKGSRENLGRPTSTPKENKELLMEFISR